MLKLNKSRFYLQKTVVWPKSGRFFKIFQNRVMILSWEIFENLVIARFDYAAQNCATGLAFCQTLSGYDHGQKSRKPLNIC